MNISGAKSVLSHVGVEARLLFFKFLGGQSATRIENENRSVNRYHDVHDFFPFLFFFLKLECTCFKYAVGYDHGILKMHPCGR